MSRVEAESIFFNTPLIMTEDALHSQDEQRMNALGQTTNNRLLHVTFTLRQDGLLIRIISSRDMNRKERTIYEQAEICSKIQERGGRTHLLGNA